ncbi:GntR family transcriptional regulator [Chelatococcus asaccharovorans]|uniref:GntR family transcriptional regulator n=1 Tax=Chelatococcus asaccharovorans TaxID=28210 RepID=A0A2V3UGK3_9HYPH|nr:GntR family transcriptional regulator [Chelatococcus asaccharovorans]MBS7701791.1 GntR family transcriptional regulator [Chelatococcus asaccharovorans]PXW64502.1 GntR family transcriptional regulator [Chelatococcus asaccharovorans]CAH1665513.1 GntR family transcriptional regulator [Chelatococcus asaccharovorans]CAH1681917.1 GntR family transcriptional regulator [Chelatococcus asaccharovorans]
MTSALPDPAELGQLVGKPGETLQETLHRTLLEMILFGYFERGARLYPQELSLKFGVSLTPVREALMRLATEGYIEAIPRRGFHIRTPTPKQVADLWQVRFGLEVMAGELAIGRLAAGELTPKSLGVLETIQGKLEAAPRRMSHRLHVDLNGRFHHSLVELSGNDLLISLYRSIQMQLLGAWIQRGLNSWRDRLESEGVEHHAIIAALRARDVEQYRAATRKHIDRSLQGALNDLSAQEPDMTLE